ncbi:MAG: outer membrane beta-barrel protein [Bacteroidales bacterium]|nr:outer membrane beta-barrel protein [Bacteroidales bacterium]
MRKILLAFFCCLCCLPAARAQFIPGGLFERNQGSVIVKVLEEKSDVPVPYASAYLTAKNDTLITNFSLTDTSGVARITKVTRGTYVLTVEMLGYKTYNKEHYFSFSWDKDSVDLGTIRLVEDTQMLDAAHVSAIGNPIEVRQDTIIFNAASFQMGQNQMLEDLLKRMPGMEVSKDGTVKYNGETIQKITVGGKTFFFDDPKMALKNLPAKVVDKVKVIDKVSDSEQFTGVATDREKVMDLEFKQEFQKGWFGNAQAGAGTTLAGSRKDEMVDNRGFLYTGNVMASGYSEKDQIVLVGGAYNAPISDDAGIIIFRYDDGDEMSETRIGGSGSGGIQTYRQLGANYNTTRIKGMESTAAANYNHSFNDSRSRSERTTFVGGGSDIFSTTENKNFVTGDNVKLNFELKNTDKKRFMVEFSPTFRYSGGKTEGYNDNESYQKDGSQRLNSSSSSNYAASSQFMHSAYFTLGLKELGGNKRRSITLSGNYSLTDYDADSREFSQTFLQDPTTPVTRDLFYVTDNRNYSGNVRLSYNEPLAERWVLSLNFNSYGSWRNNGKDAYGRTAGQPGFNPSVIDKKDYTQHNDYYSSFTKNRYVYFNESVQLQYNKDQLSMQLGAQLQETLNETRAKTLGVETETGMGEWLLDWNPYLNIRWNKQQKRINFSYSGRSTRPSAVRQMPVLDISVPTRIQAGNIYLKPAYGHNFNGNVYLNNPQQQRSFSVYLNGSLNQRKMVTASWFDDNGIQYSIPVNSAKPSLSASIYSGGEFPLTKDKKLKLELNLSVGESRSISYQNTRKLPGLDVETFDYTRFMSDFWGNEQGDRFYSGASGFSESLTNTLSLSPSIILQYRNDFLTLYLDATARYQNTHYSLDSAADTRTWSNGVFLMAEATTPHEWELATEIEYDFFFGFPAGYNDPYLTWDFKVTKNIKNFAISFTANDILNQVRTTRHITTDNYVEDAMYNRLGRHFFITLKWNFGKLNAAQSTKANRAAMNMMF